MVLNHPLSHCRGIGIRDRNDLRGVVIRLLCPLRTIDFIEINGGRVVPDQRSDEFKLALHGGVDTGLNGTHDLQCSFQNRQRRSNRGLVGHVSNLQIRYGCELTALCDDGAQKFVQGTAGFFVRQGDDGVFDRDSSHVYVSPLTRSDWGVVALDPKVFGFKPARKI